MKQQQNKISLKKLTIARVNTDAMHKIKGGSSMHTGPRHTNEGDCVTEP